MMWGKVKKLKKKLAKKLRHTHEYKLEMVAMNGHVVEACECGRRRVYVVESGHVSKFEFSEKEWKRDASTVLRRGEQMPWEDLDEVPSEDI